MVCACEFEEIKCLKQEIPHNRRPNLCLEVLDFYVCSSCFWAKFPKWIYWNLDYQSFSIIHLDFLNFIDCYVTFRQNTPSMHISMTT